ncbi:hypothetical protein CH365_12985 [Leptospira neocaledonica]|uniref:Uncharacterized protein n=1 Tax=Leptospira neocaledonica TaxID=2023192 RepID=A0A2M9ZWG7_9LEPT|nr:hypothetical protein CH365_12985 [Leptospira neocaledonica]
MDIKRQVAKELRFLFILTIMPAIIWAIIAILIELFNLNSPTCRENERLTYESFSDYCEEIIKADSNNSEYENFQVPAIRKADGPILSWSFREGLYWTFLMLVLFLYPISLLARIFIWAFRFK